MSVAHAEPTPEQPPHRWGARVWRVLRGALALVGAAVLTITALAALGFTLLFGRSPEHDAEQNVAAFTEEVTDLPHVRTVDGVRLGVADMLQPVRNAFARVVLDDGATLATLRRTADRLRPWTTGSETDDRVHPEIDLDGYSVTVSPSAAVTDSRIRLLVAAQEDAALRGARFVVAQPGDDYFVDETNDHLAVQLVVADAADAAETFRRWEALLRPVAPRAAVTVSIGAVEEADLLWASPGERWFRTSLAHPPDRAVLAAVTAVMADPAVTRFSADVDASRAGETETVSVEVLVDDQRTVQRVLSDIAAMPGSASLTSLGVEARR